MEELPLVSVVSGYYNRTKNLKECVQSILDQTYPNFEYIIFDDCSTDGTYELLREFDDPRLTLFRTEQNGGFTKGVIQAINQYAKGEYIAIQGAGDISYKERIAKQAAVLQDNSSVGIVSCDWVDIQADGSKVGKVHQDKDVVFSKIILHKSVISQGEVMFRRSCYEQAGGYDPWIEFAQDRDLWIRMRNHCDFYRISEVLYERPYFEKSVSQNLSKLVEQRFFTSLSRERAIKGRKFSLLFRDKYQWVADQALTLHFRNPKSKHRKHLLDACRRESDNLLTALYLRFHWLPVVNWVLYKLVGRRALKIHTILTTTYRDLPDEQIYRLAVLRKTSK
jgi:glycosyltransferase involved in cell wall biosynthesis